MSDGVPRSAVSRWGVWIVLAVAAIVALALGSRPGGGPATVEERTQAIAERIKCPTCEGLSVAQSQAGAARAITGEIQRQLLEGNSRSQIYAYLRSKYGTEEFLVPSRTGIASVVWVLPVAFLVVAFAGLVVAFRRWRPSGRIATDADRVLVERALREGGSG